MADKTAGKLAIMSYLNVKTVFRNRKFTNGITPNRHVKYDFHYKNKAFQSVVAKLENKFVLPNSSFLIIKYCVMHYYCVII